MFPLLVDVNWVIPIMVLTRLMPQCTDAVARWLHPLSKSPSYTRQQFPGLTGREVQDKTRALRALDPALPVPEITPIPYCLDSFWLTPTP